MPDQLTGWPTAPYGACVSIALGVAIVAAMLLDCAHDDAEAGGLVGTRSYREAEATAAAQNAEGNAQVDGPQTIKLPIGLYFFTFFLRVLCVLRGEYV